MLKLAPESEGLGVVDLVSAPFSFSSAAARQHNLTRAVRQRQLWRGDAVPRCFVGASPVTSCFKHLETPHSYLNLHFLTASQMWRALIRLLRRFKWALKKKNSRLMSFYLQTVRALVHVFLEVYANNAFDYQFCGSIVGKFHAGFGPWCVFDRDLFGGFCLRWTLVTFCHPRPL